MRVLLIFALLFVSALAAQKRYDGYQVLELQAKDIRSFNAILKLYTEGSGIYDFWTEPRGIDHPIDIMISPANARSFSHFLQTHNIEHRVKISDVQKSIDISREPQVLQDIVKDPRSRAAGSSRYVMNWDNYYDYTTISVFLAQLTQAHPDKVKLLTIGKTIENRDMYMVKISNNATNGAEPKNAIIIDGGIHAREWIAPAFTTWLMHELVENYAAHPEYVDNLDWFILPVMNPDGYAYSWAVDRMWRKNRRALNGNCYGVDLNRNFGFHWNEGGSSGNGCDETYHGTAAFSEPESAHVRDAILSVASRSKAYLTYHSYGQYWLTPWGYTAELPSDYYYLYDLALQACNKLKEVNGTQYTIGSSTNLLYVASGGSDDWAKGGAGIAYSYTVELRDTGDYGFLLPADQITPNNVEMWEAVKVVAEFFMPPPSTSPPPTENPTTVA